MAYKFRHFSHFNACRTLHQGLHHLQHKGVCHRDLSLENVLVDGDKCMIIDMGMCLRVPYNDGEDPGKIADVSKGSIRRLMKPQGVCGKHNYMSPEIAANSEPFDGFAIDLWAAGVRTDDQLSAEGSTFDSIDSMSLCSGIAIHYVNWVSTL
jgi:serine/threonine protein kinase